MGFRENLLKKIEINKLAHTVLRSINPTDGTQRIDRGAMQQFLDLGAYHRQKERDLELYVLGNDHILVLDNELKIYNTTIADVGLRKSPTIKEMISIKNAIKILNDKDVVISRKESTVQWVRKNLTDDLDLSYNETDIVSMAKDGTEALKNKYGDGVVEILTLFAELLGFEKAPKIFRMPHHQIWGKSTKTDGIVFGPAVIFSLIHNTLKMCHKQISLTDKEGLRQFRQIVNGEIDADLSNTEVIDALKQAVISQSQTTHY